MANDEVPVRAATARERARAAFTEDLMAAARARLAEHGAMELSLRAVARDLGVASSAVYRYVESRDALLTRLIIEAYDDVGAACEAAAERGRADGDPPAQVLLAVTRAFRGWALAHPRSFELVYGTPVPGYAAPQDTVGPALRLWRVLVGLVLEAHGRGELLPTAPPIPGEGLVEAGALEFGRAIATELGQLGADGPGGEVAPTWGEPEVLHCFTLFATLIGATTAELFGHLHRAAADYAAVHDAVIATAAAAVGLRIDLTAGR